MSNKPKNIELYKNVKNEAKKKFKVYPSIYANSWVVKEYKKRGGTYIGKKSKSKGLLRWYKEKWIDVCKLPKIVSCGRSKLSKNWKKNIHIVDHYTKFLLKHQEVLKNFLKVKFEKGVGQKDQNL